MLTDAELLENDLRARREALDISQSFIVQAPAGSGKTELLIQRYLTLLGSVTNPEEVVAITFTRKAAAEMQLRVVNALQRAAGDEEATQEHERITLEAARRVLERDQEFDWRVVANPRRLRIQTLDSLNASIAGMQPISESGTVRGGSVADDVEARSMYRQAAAQTLDWLDEEGALHNATVNVLNHLDNNTGLFIDYIARMLATRDQWLPIVSTGLMDEKQAQGLRQHFENCLQHIVSDYVSELDAVWPHTLDGPLIDLWRFAAENLVRDGKPDHLIASACEPDAWPASSPESQARWVAVAELLLVKGGGWRKRLTKNEGFPPGTDAQKDSLFEIVAQASEVRGLNDRLHGVRNLPPLHYSNEQWSVLLALFRLLPMAVAELQRIFNANGATDYIEIAIAAGNALGSADTPGDLTLLLDYQIRHILVDEMQDTSHAQYAMLEALTGGWEAGDGRTLFCVGDPMQSIYRFRNAEVAQFLLARQNGVGQVSLSELLLRQNFRSGENLVHWFNTVFSCVLPAENDALSGAVCYSESVSIDQYRDQGDCHIYPLFGSSRHAEAQRGLEIICGTLAEHPQDDMAVLVRGRTQLHALLDELRTAKVDYQAIEIDRLTDLPEIIDMLSLARAIAHLGDRIAWLALLRSPWIGLDWSDVHTLVSGDSHSTVIELLMDEERIQRLSDAGRNGLSSALPILKALASHSVLESLRTRVENTWLALGGPAIAGSNVAVENVYRFLEVLERIEYGGTLRDVAELEAQLDQVRVSNASGARLQVMTMHRAKGLQFDHVMLYGLGRTPRANTREVLSWFDIPSEDGSNAKVISPVGPRAEVDNDRIHRFIEQTKSVKDGHEQGRLLYVACTRARKSLHLLGHVGISSDGQSLADPDKRTLLAMLWPAVRNQYEDAFDPATAVSGDNSKDWLLPTLRRFESGWQLPDTKPLAGLTGVVESGEQQAVEYYWVGLDARLAGTVVHRCLQYFAEGRLPLSADSIETLRPLSVRWLQELGAGESSLSQIQSRIDAVLSAILADQKARWLIEGEGHSELSLSGMVNGRLVTGIIDRVRVDGDTHWIVDYKTSSHEGGGLDQFLQAEADRYRGQLARYSALYQGLTGKTACCALYFPLLQRFVEVTLQDLPGTEG